MLRACPFTGQFGLGGCRRAEQLPRPPRSARRHGAFSEALSRHAIALPSIASSLCQLLGQSPGCPRPGRLAWGRRLEGRFQGRSVTGRGGQGDPSWRHAPWVAHPRTLVGLNRARGLDCTASRSCWRWWTAVGESSGPRDTSQMHGPPMRQRLERLGQRFADSPCIAASQRFCARGRPSGSLRLGGGEHAAGLVACSSALTILGRWPIRAGGLCSLSRPGHEVGFRPRNGPSRPCFEPAPRSDHR